MAAPEGVDIDEARQRRVRQAARALDRAGLVTAYGHCSERIDDRTFLVCRAGPMGTIGRGEPGIVVEIDGPLPTDVLGEVRVHQQIYRRRPDIAAVCRVLPPQLMALSTMGLVPAMRHGFAAFFHAGIGFWDDPSLIRDDVSAKGVAQALGESGAVVLRGNGCVVVAEDLRRAVTLSCYLEDAARIELLVRSSGGGGEFPLLTQEEAVRRATWAGRPAERMWDYLLRDDIENAEHG